MKVKVKIYGTLRQRFPRYRHQHGIAMEIPERTKVKNLLALLNIPYLKGVSVIMEGRVLKEEDTIPPGAAVSVFQAIHGG